MKHFTAFFRTFFAWMIGLPLIMLGCALFLVLGLFAVLLLPVFFWVIRRQIQKLGQTRMVTEPFIPQEIFEQMAEAQRRAQAAQTPAAAQPPAAAEPYDYEAYYAWYYQQYGHYPQQTPHAQPDYADHDVTEAEPHADQSPHKSS